MEILQLLIPLLMSGALAALVLAVGLDAKVGDVAYLLLRPLLLLRAFLAISVVVPVAAVIAVSLLPLPITAKAGILLMAAAPVPPLVPGKGLKAGGRREYVYGLYAAFAFLAVAIVPITVAILDSIYRGGASITPAAIAPTVLGGVLAPLVIGMVVHAIAPRTASAAAVWIGRLSMLLLVLVFVPLIVRAWPAMEDLIGNGTLLAMIGVAIVAVAGGHLLGGPDPRDRAVLAGAAATRHPGIAMLIANANFTDPHINAAILMFLLVALLVFGIYQIAMKREARRAAHAF